MLNYSGNLSQAGPSICLGWVLGQGTREPQAAQEPCANSRRLLPSPPPSAEKRGRAVQAARPRQVPLPVPAHPRHCPRPHTMASTLQQYEPRHSHNMQVRPFLVTTRTRHAAKGPAFGPCSKPTRGKTEDTLENPNVPNRLKQGSEDGRGTGSDDTVYVVLRITRNKDQGSRIPGRTSVERRIDPKLSISPPSQKCCSWGGTGR